jgi:SAM-dependent methyltransferase
LGRVGDDVDAVVRHYEASREEGRLAGGIGQLELARTQEILRRHLPGPPGRVLDVGGGTGVHAAWLLDDGYVVDLLDITPKLVGQAHAELGRRGLAAGVGDARRLPVAADRIDAALLLGPLYHLVERADRVLALSEAGRVVRPGGVVAVAAISRFASLFDGLVREFIFDPEFWEIVRQDFADGRHVNPHNHPHWFTTAYFHRPEELRSEITEAGLSVVELVGVEGLAGWLPHLQTRWADDRQRETMLDAARLVEAEPAVLGLSAHLLAIARVPR